MVAALQTSTVKASFETWHYRLGHIPFAIISSLNKLGHLSVTSVLPKPGLYSPCQLAKNKYLSFMLNEKRVNVIFDLIHCALWGPAPIYSRDGYRYCVMFVDDFSRFTWSYPLKAKFDFYDSLVRFTVFVCNQFSNTIKVLQSDGDTEFFNGHVREFFASRGIPHRTSCPYTPQQNG